MSQFGYDLPGDEPDDGEVDIDGQLAAAEAERKAAEARLAALRKQHGRATPPSGGKPPAVPGEIDLDALLAKVGDRSRSWPEIASELETLGFTGATSAPSTRGMRQR